MHLDTFLQDLALIMIVAGIVTIIFHKFKQPVVLGYILAGVILGPHTPSLVIQDEATIKTLAEVGVIFLMFTLGLDFSIRKLFSVGAAALIAALAEIIFMIFVGYEIGNYFGWKTLDSLFLGAMLAISSTTIIIKALDELNLKRMSFAHLIFGILIIEDILAIGMLALLSSIAVTGSIDAGDVVVTLGKLLVFLVTTYVIGILTIPRLLSYVAKFNNREMLLVTVLGLIFGFCLLVMWFDYSIALGAFVIGAIVAEVPEMKLIEKLVEPITDMFSAIFFVSIGLLVDPNIIVTYIVPIAVITLAVVVGKVIMCSLGVFIAGRDGKTSMRVGMGLAQIGEFSFIIASLGMSLKVTSHFLYPIIVAVSAITTLLTPYLIKIADPFTEFLSRAMPSRVTSLFGRYTRWLQSLKPTAQHDKLMHAIKMGFLSIFINLTLVVGIFVMGSFLAHSVKYMSFFSYYKFRHAFIWGGALVVSLPCLIAIYRKIKGLSVILAELSLKVDAKGKRSSKMEFVISELIPILSMLGIAFIVLLLSTSILPPIELLLGVIFIVLVLAAIGWRWFIKFHSKLQILFMNQFDDLDKE